MIIPEALSSIPIVVAKNIILLSSSLFSSGRALAAIGLSMTSVVAEIGILLLFSVLLSVLPSSGRPLAAIVVCSTTGLSPTFSVSGWAVSSLPCSGGVDSRGGEFFSSVSVAFLEGANASEYPSQSTSNYLELY